LPGEGQEEQGVEGLVLGGGRYARDRQAGEERLKLLLGGECRTVFVFEEGAVTGEPVGMGFFGVDGEVAAGANLL
jgi:hypothetical protein